LYKKQRGKILMTTQGFTTRTKLGRGYSKRNHLSHEGMDDIYNLSRQLVATNTLDVLLESIARNAVEILKIKFSRILTIDFDGSFRCQVAFPNSLSLRSQRIRKEPAQAQQVYKKAILNDSATLIGPKDKAVSMDTKRALRMDGTNGLYLIPLRVEDTAIGLLVLGGNWAPAIDSAQQEKLRMAEMIADQAAGAIYRARLSYRLEESSLETVLALAKTVEARDQYTGGHSNKMVDLSEQIARKLNCNFAEVQNIRWAALLHDIGKIGIPDQILHRSGPLTKEEWVIMRQHPQIGAEIVLMVSNLAHVAMLILSHHERYDGTGYPNGLQQEEIPLGARILAVADAYSAITDGRVYRPARSHREAISELQNCTGKDFDPRVVKAFLSVVEQYVGHA